MQCPNPKSLQALLDETLAAEEQPTIQAHLETCPRCQKVLEHLAAGGVTWDKTAENLGKPAGDETALLQAVNNLQSVPNPEQTQADASKPPLDVDLSFLQPSEKPNSLGRLDKYEILSVVGKGGFGIVLKGFDESLHRVVAIKAMLPQLASNGTARQRFIREARAAAPIAHENVVTIHEVKGDVPVPYLVMQFVDGVTLGDKIEKTGALGLKEILRIGMQAAEGLAAAKKQGLVHRDIKPANILLENGIERVKITDFGLARAADDASLTQSGVVAGTPMYMSPEQADGKPVDHRSDLFSLGSVLYVMCTGKPPFRANSTMAVLKRVCEETPRPIRESNPELPEWLDGVITKLHAKKPEERFQTASEVAELLGQHLAELQAGRSRSVSDRSAPPSPITPTPVAHAPGAPRQKRRWSIGIPILVGLFVIVAVLAIQFWRGDEPTPPPTDKPQSVPVADKDRLQGTWVAVSASTKGLKLSKATIKTLAPTVTFSSNRVNWKANPMPESGDLGRALNTFGTGGTFQIDPTKSPKTIDMRVLRKDKGNPHAAATGHEMLGIYRLGGDTLELCVAIDPDLREEELPTKFDSVSGKFTVYLVLKRLSDQPAIDPGKIEIKALPPSPAESAVRPLFVFTDPDGDCQIKHQYKRNTITVPAGDHHLSAVKSNLPRLLQEVDGDFVAEVTLPPAQYPPPKILAQAEHLIVWHDRQNVLVNQRVVSSTGEGKAPTFQLSSNGSRDGKSIGIKSEDVRPDLALHLKIERIGNDFLTFHRLEGAGWTQDRKFSLEWPRKLKIGVAASNGCDRPFTAHFDDFRLASQPGWVSLFNGKDLTGWKMLSQQEGNWRAIDGVIEGRGPTGGLFTERGDYADFHLRAEAKIAKYADSGVFMRAPFAFLTGKMPYAVSLSMTDKKNPLGSLSGLKTADPSVKLPGADQWFPFDVIALGNRLTIKINGATTVDFVDEKNAYARGHIALHQMVSDVVQFRKIEIKELAPGTLGKSAPDLSKAKPFYQARFQNPVEDWPIEKQDDYDQGFAKGRYYITVDAGASRSCYFPAEPIGDFVCEAVGRVSGSPAAQWGAGNPEFGASALSLPRSTASRSWRSRRLGAERTASKRPARSAMPRSNRARSSTRCAWSCKARGSKCSSTASSSVSRCRPISSRPPPLSACSHWPTRRRRAARSSSASPFGRPRRCRTACVMRTSVPSICGRRARAFGSPAARSWRPTRLRRISHASAVSR